MRINFASEGFGDGIAMTKVFLTPESAVDILNLLLQNEQSFVSEMYSQFFNNNRQVVVQWFYLNNESSNGPNHQSI